MQLFSSNCSIMEIVLVLHVVFLDYALTTYAGISHAETSDITRLTEGVPSPECNEGGCIVQDEGVNLINTVTVHKRHAKHIKHGKVTKKPGKVTKKPGKGTKKPGKVTKKHGKVTEKPGKVTIKHEKVTKKLGKGTKKPGKSVRHLIHQTAKEAKSITKRIQNEVKKRKLKTSKLAKKRKNNLSAMSNKISTLLKMSTEVYSKITLKPDVVKNITVSNGQNTLNLVKKHVDIWEKSIEEAAVNTKEINKLYLDELKKFSFSSNKNVKGAVRSGDIKGAKKILHKTHKTTQQIVESVSQGAKEMHDTAEKQVKSLGMASENAIADTARRQAEQLKEIAKQNPYYKVIDSMSTKVTQYSYDSAAMNRKLTNIQLQMASEYRKYVDGLIKNVSYQAYELGEAIVNSDAEAVKRKEAAMKEAFEKAEEDNEKYFDKLVSDAHDKSSLVLSKASDYVSSLNSLKFQ